MSEVLNPIVVQESEPVEKTARMIEAVFSAVVERPSAITQFYDVHPIIGVYDVEQAFIRCTQFFSTYKVIESSVSVEIKTENGEFLRASSLSELKQYDEAQRSCVKNVDCEFHFLVKTDTLERPASFKVELNFRDVPAMFKSSFIEVPDEVKSPIRLHIEFPDYVIARSVKFVVDDWIKTLRIVQAGKAQIFAGRFAKKMNELSPAIIGFFVALGGFLWVRNGTVSNSEAIQIASFLIALYYAIRVMNRLLGNALVKTVSQYSLNSGFQITAGDRERMKARQTKNDRLQRWASFIIVAIVLNFAVGLAGEHFYSFVAPSDENEVGLEN
jgi:hypothetical protein